MSAARGAAWPDPQELRLLQAAVLPAQHAVASWEAWVAAGGDLDGVVEGETYRLLPQLWFNLAESGREDPELGRLSGIYRHAWVRNQRLLRRGGLAVDALREAGVETMLLKGGALVTGVGRSIGTRPMEDVDVLVRPGDAPRAIDVLAGLGYHHPNRLPLSESMRAWHGGPLYRRDDDQIDLHWSAFQVPGDEERIWRAAVPVALGTTTTLVPAPAHQLLIICAHGLRWPRAPLRWVADAALLLQSDAEVEWALFVSTAVDRDLTVESLAALRLLREGFGLPVPAAAIEALERAPVPPVTRVAYALRGAPYHVQVLLAWADSYRRLRRRPYGPSGPARDLVDHMRIVLDLSSRRAVLRWAGRRARAARQA